MNTRTLVNQVVADAVSAKKVVTVHAVLSQILALRADVTGKDAHYYISHASKDICAEIRRCINRYNDIQPSAEAQLVMSGYENLRVAYSVARYGEQALVPLELMTDEEIDGRAEHIDAVAKTCRIHAQELRLYKRRRAAAALTHEAAE